MNYGQGVYVVRDRLTNHFGLPLFFTTPVEAVRAFCITASDGDSLIRSRPQDFELFRIASYWPENGDFTVLAERQLLCSGDGAPAELQRLIDLIEGSDNGN